MKINHIFALLAISAGLFASFTNHSARNDFYPTWKFDKGRELGAKVHFISPHHLAEMLYQKQELILQDVRSQSGYDEYHIPTALHLKADQKQEGSKKAGIRILYGSAEDENIYALSRELPGKVYVLKGGIEAWYSLVLFPDMLKYRIRNSDQLKQVLLRCSFFGGEAQNTQILNINVRESRYREGC